MNIKKLLSLIVVLILTSTSLLTGCNKQKKVETVKREIDKTQYLNLTLDGEPKTLDQSKAKERSSFQILSEINESLTRIETDSSGKEMVKQAGAESWEISEDRLKWIFHIRDNQWSDGKKVTAKDYEYGIKRTLDPEIQSSSAFLLYAIKGSKKYNDIKINGNKSISPDVLGVKALNDKTLEIDLEYPCAYFTNITSSVAMQPQRKDIVEKYKDKYGTDTDKMVFCGPFTIKQWIHNDRIELYKNEKYWDSKSVKLQKANFKIFKQNNTIIGELSNGSLDMAQITNIEFKNKIKKESKFDLIKKSQPTTDFEFFNEKSKLFSNVNIRKAFSLAIDREDVSKTLWKGLYMPAYAFVPPSLQIGKEDFREKSNFEPIKKLKDDSGNPRKLLEQGLKELGMDTDPSKITIKYIQPGMDAKQKDIAEFFKKMYEKNLGINIKIEYADKDNFSKKLESGDYELGSMTWFADYNDPMAEFYLWTTGSNIISTNWSNNKYDSLIINAASLSENKNEDRFNNFKQAENILLVQDVVIAPTVYRSKEVYKYKYVKNVMFTLFGAPYEIKYAYTEGR
ncbi:peptide ABC transporter substrate-binding protein [Clostridium sp. P21]|uniref:Peptide ABC transporter substrate-binding protein n=1 Tax=Clostridium muellerianum TaxID=2716538 RepID=A0A7Y0EIE5_9CLOT|nr:peptide ABC transporter substrate-binding protein [Clostridium muellerianum]NMM64054.1 peptide ABC transporter substrate-binding protein [Clostridium muellerianum]